LHWTPLMVATPLFWANIVVFAGSGLWGLVADKWGRRPAIIVPAIIGAFIARRSQAENVAFFEKAEVTIGPIYDITQILEDPPFIHREVLADYPAPDMGAFPMHHVVPRLAATPGAGSQAPVPPSSPAVGCSKATVVGVMILV